LETPAAPDATHAIGGGRRHWRRRHRGRRVHVGPVTHHAARGGRLARIFVKEKAAEEHGHRRAHCAATAARAERRKR